MKLIQIYECFCDETRLRILNLLALMPLCVSDLQKALQLNQVKMSKHLHYLKERGMVNVVRAKNKRIYSLTKNGCAELDYNMRCLQDCSREYPIFKEDLRRLEALLNQPAKTKERL